jgi:hypothetical protein
MIVLAHNYLLMTLIRISVTWGVTEMLLHCIHTLHLRSVVHRMKMLLHRIHTIHLHHIATHYVHTLLPQPMVRRVVLLLNHMHTLHLRHIHTIHLNMFALEVVTTRVVGRIPLIQLKLLRGQRNKMSGLTTTRKIWYFSI